MTVLVRLKDKRSERRNLNPGGAPTHFNYLGGRDCAGHQFFRKLKNCPEYMLSCIARIFAKTLQEVFTDNSFDPHKKPKLSFSAS